MIDELPQGWESVKLGEITSKVGSGATPRGGSESYGTQGVPLIRSMNVRFEGFTTEGLAFLNKAQAKALDAVTVKSGDVLLNITGASIGRVTQAPASMNGARVNQHVCIIRPKPELDATFLARFLASPPVQRMIWIEQYGVTRQALTKGQILAFDIPLPSLAEQRRIVAKLEKLVDRVEASQQRLAKLPALLKRFRQSVLAAACSGRLTADWRDENRDIEPASTTIEKLKLTTGAKVRRGVPESVPMSDVVEDWDLPETWGCYSAADLLRCGAFVDVKDGNHGANHPKVSEFTKTGLPFITAAQVNNFRVDYDSAYKLSGKPLDRIRVGFAESGDVIYTHKGSVGRVAIADRDCVLTPQTTYYRVDPKAFANGFVMFYLASQAFSEQANVVKEQTTRDFVPISEQYLLFHRVPPLPEQKEIVRRVEGLFALADRIEVRFAEGQKRVNVISQAILAKAFRGELVPTEFELAKAEGRSFESAEELLERIKRNGGQRNKLQKAVRTSKKRGGTIQKDSLVAKGFSQ